LNILFIKNFLFSDFILDLLFLLSEALPFAFCSLKLKIQFLSEVISSIFAVVVVSLHHNALFDENLVFFGLFFEYLMNVVVVKDKPC